MCSIFGMGFFKGNKLDGEQVKKFQKDLFINCEARGTDASGLLYTRKDNGMRVVKNNVRASYFVYTDYYKREEETNFNSGVSNLWSIVGHCRQQTKGTHHNNLNNHPIVRDTLVGVHNGHISNDDSIFSVNNLKRHGEVDSEAIFALIESGITKSKKIHEAITDSSKKIVGAFACGMVHRSHPHLLWLFKRHNPCDIVVYKDAGMIVFASDERYIRNAACDKFGKGEKLHIGVDSGMTIDLHRKIYFEFKL